MNKVDLTNEQIVDYITKAFVPYKCYPEIWDYDKKLKLKVFDEKNLCVINYPELLLSNLRSINYIDSIIFQCNQKLKI